MMKRACYWISVLFLGSSSILWAQGLDFRPIVFGIGHSAGGVWQGESEDVLLTGWGAVVRHQVGAWDVWAELVMARYFGLIPVAPNSFTPEQGISWAQFASYSEKERDTHITNMRVTYTRGNFMLEAGKFSRSWGPGLTSLIVSDKPPTYPQFGFDWHVVKNIRFIYFHGKLNSGILDSVRTFSNGIQSADRKVYVERYIAAHRIEWSILDNLDLAVSEIVIYGGRGIDIHYHLPFVLFYSMQTYLEDTDNVELAIDINWRPSPRLRIYGAFLLDDWDFYQIFDEINNNKLAWQTGFEWQGLLHPSDQILVEYNWTDHRVYWHKYLINDIYNKGYPIGFWGGPHSQSLFTGYGFTMLGTKWMVSYSDAIRGQVTQEMREEYSRFSYDRLSGPTEKLRQLRFNVERRLFQNVILEFGVQRIWWTNPGFDPFDPSDDNHDGTDLPIVNKTSFTIGLFYNFKYPGHGHPYQLKS